MTGVLAAPFVIGAGGVFDAETSVTAMHQIWSQLVGLLVITAWAASVSSLIFFTLNLNNKLRLPREVELAGCDVIKHGEAAYPANAWLDVSTCMHASGGFYLSGVKSRKISDQESQLHLIEEAPAVKLTTFDIESSKDTDIPEEEKDKLGSSIVSEISNDEDTIHNEKVMSERVKCDNKSFEPEES